MQFQSILTGLSLSMMFVSITAHVGFGDRAAVSANAGQNVLDYFKVPHGCTVGGDHFGTIGVRAWIPNTLTGVAVSDAYNFAGDVKLESGGSSIVEWTAVNDYAIRGESTYFGLFGISFKIAATAPPGKIIMPLYQICRNNSFAWWNTSVSVTVVAAPTVVPTTVLPTTTSAATTTPTDINKNTIASSSSSPSSSDWTTSDTISIIAIVLSAIAILMHLKQYCTSATSTTQAASQKNYELTNSKYTTHNNAGGASIHY